MQKELQLPKELSDALDNDKMAKDVFEAYSFSHQKEYVNYIVEAKTPDTRLPRVGKTMLLLKEKKK